MMKKIILLSFIMSISYCINVKGQTSPTKHEQYDFLKWYIKYKPLKSLSRVPHSDSIEFFPIDSIALRDLKLDLADKQYILHQFTLTNQKKKFLIDSTKLKDADWQTQSFRPGITITYISMPLFSIDKKTVLIYRNTYCGPLCGEGGWEAYIKTGDHTWVKCITHHFPHFIS